MPVQADSAVRSVSRVIQGMPASDGAGVRLRRLIGTPELPQLDPFLMLDLFRSDQADDYLAGFPDHPHRGFETVTYLIAGRMRHRDSAGHQGVIEPGGVQWMTAGRGIVHSEMPEQQDGLLAGFQLWINLPAQHKLDPPRYQEFPGSEIPVERRNAGSELRVIAGTSSRGTAGPVQQPLTGPVYFDLRLPARVVFSEPLAGDLAGFILVYDGDVTAAGQSGDQVKVERDQLGILSAGQRVELRAGASGAGLLLIAGRPLREPVARWGPFVMNTEAEIRQAISDYQQGRMG